MMPVRIKKKKKGNCASAHSHDTGACRERCRCASYVNTVAKRSTDAGAHRNGEGRRTLSFNKRVGVHRVTKHVDAGMRHKERLPMQVGRQEARQLEK